MRDWVHGSYLPPRLIDVRPASDLGAAYGLAVDVGTTSVVAYLVDFATARVTDSSSAYNRQIACGDDVISRILYARRKGGLERLQRLVVRDHQRAHRQARNADRRGGPRHPRGRHRRQHDDDPSAARAGPALPARGALHADDRGAPQARRRRARPEREPGGARARHAGGGQLRRRRHHGRRDQLRAVRHRPPHALHRHRHQRRDRAGRQGLADRLRLLGGPRLRGWRRRARHAGELRRHRGRLGQRRDLRADVSHDRRRAGRRACAAAA